MRVVRPAVPVERLAAALSLVVLVGCSPTRRVSLQPQESLDGAANSDRRAPAVDIAPLPDATLPDASLPDANVPGRPSVGATLGLWHMDEEGSNVSTLVDASGLGNDLVRADTWQDVTGHPGRFGLAVGKWAHETNIGDGVAQYFANTSLAGTAQLSELTFEFWLFVRASGVDNDPNPFGLGDDDDDCFRIDDLNALEYRNEGIAGNLRSIGVLPLGTWMHVALTWDAHHARLWLNGKLIKEVSSSGLSAINVLRVGGHTPWNANLSSGYVDEARLSNVVRYSSRFDPPQAPFCITALDCARGVCSAEGVCAAGL